VNCRNVFPPLIRLIVINKEIISKLILNIKVTNDLGTVSIALLSGLLIVVAAIGIVGPQKAVGQAEEVFSENTTFANQTAAPIPPTANTFTLPGETGTQNQTQTAPVNLTRADMEPVTSALNSARDSLLGNGTLQDAYTSLNDADVALFRIAQDEGPSATTTIVKMSEPMRSHIEGAQQALLVGDAPKALDERNSAEVVLLGIIQGLPAEEEEPSAEEEEPSAEEEE
jgi:hypothetical protein